MRQVQHGCAVSDAELGLLAGADRIEGTLFGNGERTGNVDIITLAMNMYSQGVDPGLDFSNIPKITELYEKVTRMDVYARQPYAGKLVFAAFSGSHQDAIAKGMNWREEMGDPHWTVPYLPIDPTDVGRVYETDVIRINSQSGKGGIAYLLEHTYGYISPQKMRENVGYTIKDISDNAHAELSPAEVLEAFKENYINIDAPIKVLDCHFNRAEDITAYLTLQINGEKKVLIGIGNGRLDAVNKAIKSIIDFEYSNLTYEEHALTSGSTSKAVTYVSITNEDGKKIFGVGEHDDIIQSSINALVSAVNKAIIMNK